MIRISQIDSELSVYRDKKIVLWDSSEYAVTMVTLLQFHNIAITAFCDERKEKWGSSFLEIPIISPDELKKSMANDANILVQSTDRLGDIVALKCKFQQMSITNFIFANEAVMILKFRAIEKLAAQDKRRLVDLDISVNHSGIILNKQFEMKQALFDCLGRGLVLFCLPPKTGDYTLNHTFTKNQIPYYQTAHCPRIFDREFIRILPNVVKIVTAVRDPIAQNISALFQCVSSLPYQYTRIFKTIELGSSSVLEDGGDVQFFFDSWIRNIEESEENDPDQIRPFVIQKFIPIFQEYVLDIMKEPFPKEQGYQVVKEGNVEVFVYKLERMNDILPAISEFTGENIDSWVMGNVSSDKWIAESYKKAQKELKITQKYFDDCYSQPYVKHFYSELEIDKFKSKWRGNFQQ